MSQENVEIVRRGWEAWVRGDLDALLELCDPAVGWDTTHMEGWPEDAVYFGRDGVRRFLEEWLGSWEWFESGAEKILEAGGDRVVVICWQQGFGPGSEVPVHMDWAQICTLQRGLVCRVEAYSDRAQALEAAGLREEAMSQENVELAYRVWDAVSQRDLDAHLALYDPDVEIEPRTAVAVGISYHGQDGVRRWWDDMLSAFPDIGMEVLEARDLGDLTLTATRIRGHGAGSDVLVEQTLWQVIEWRDKKCVWWGSYGSEREALEAVGLRE